MKRFFTILFLFTVLPAFAQPYTIKGKAVDSISGQQLCHIKVELITAGEVKAFSFTDSLGNYSIHSITRSDTPEALQLRANTANYRTKKGRRYMPAIVTLDISPGSDSIIQLPEFSLKRRALPSITPAIHFKKNSIEEQEYFDGMDTISIVYCAQLVSDVLFAKKMVIAEVQGYNERDETNANLCADRAEKVRAALEELHTDMTRVSVKLYGTVVSPSEGMLYVKNESKTGEQEVDIMNRRAMVRLSIDEKLIPLVFKLTGVVTDCKNNVPVENVTVNILGSDGYAQQVRTDKTGYYEVSLQDGLSYVITTDAKTSLKTTYAARYLNSTEKGKLTTVGEKISKTFKKDFCLTPATCCWSFPGIHFEKSSANYSNGYDYVYAISADSALALLVYVLNENPGIVIELSGHGDKMEPAALSQQRAEKVKNDLIKLGIAPDRLIAKGYGNHKPLINDAEVSKLKTKEEKEAAQAKNRRVVFRIIRWDYISDASLQSPPLFRVKSLTDEKDMLKEE